MRISYFKILAVTTILTSVFYFNVYAQWQKMPMPFGGYIQSFAQKDNIIYSGTAENGLFYSSDEGVSWSKLVSLPGTNIKSLAVNGAFIFAISEKGFYKSSNDGLTWQSIRVGNVNRDVKSQNGIIYLNDQNGIYMSNDNGVNWTLYSINQGTYLFGFGGNTVLAIPGGAHVYISNDKGATWSDKYLDYFVSTNAGAVYNNKIYVGTWGHGVYVSSNGGDSWKRITDPLLSNGYISYIGINGSSIYVCADGVGVVVSNDDGATWANLSAGLNDNNFTTMHFSTNKAFTGTSSGIYSSDDNGKTWNSSNNGIKANIITAFAKNKDNFFLGTNHGLLTSNDYGLTWQLQSALISKSIKSIFTENDNVFIGTTNGIFYSSNNGTTWVSRGLSGNSYIIYDFAKYENNYLAATNGGVFLTDNLGASWTVKTSGWPNIHVSLKVNEGIIYSGSINGAIFSSDGCKTWNNWTSLNNYTGNETINSFTFIGDNYFVNTSYQGIYQSKNKGVNWEKMFIYPNSMTVCKDTLYLGTSDGLLSSSDYGANYNKMDTLTIANVTLLKNYNDVVYACTSSLDVWYKGIFTNIKQIQQNKCLFFPNPADKEILFANDDNTKLDIRIIDMTGKIIVSGKLSNSDKTIDISKIANGVYLVKAINNDGITSTNKLRIQHVR